MAMIKRADAQTIARDAMVLDLGDLARQGESMMKQARARAEAIIADAHKERERILAGARELGHAEGRKAGHAEGLAAGREEGKKAAIAESSRRIEAMCTSWSSAVGRFSELRNELTSQARQDLLALALEIAQRITRRAIQNDPASVAAALESAVALVLRPTRARIRIHPDDDAAARELLPGLLSTFDRVKHAEIVLDPSIERGGCILQAEGGASIDATIATQFDRIVDALLPRSEES